MSRGLCLYSCIVDVTARGKVGKGVHSEGKGGERAMAIPRFQGGSPRLCELRTTPFWPRWFSGGRMGH
jgi:hypothetical protein